MEPHEPDDDLLQGAAQIAKFLFGPTGTRRQAYHLSQFTRAPLLRRGTRLCARRSVLLDWISAQENRALPLGLVRKPHASEDGTSPGG
jgi:hypothetical protein